MSPTIGIIVQARMSSQRLPGKVLREIAGKPMLLYTLERVALARGVAGTIVATSDAASDDPVAAFCVAHGIPCFRGSLPDVAGRFLAAAESYGYDAFVRVCGDSPFTDPEVITEMIALFRSGTYDLVTNTFPRSFPKGISVEVVRTTTFRAASARMVEPADREHVTRYYYAHPEAFRIRSFAATRDDSATQLSVDTPEDLDMLTSMVQQMERPHTAYGYRELLNVMRRMDERVAAALPGGRAL